MTGQGTFPFWKAPEGTTYFNGYTHFMRRGSRWYVYTPSARDRSVRTPYYDTSMLFTTWLGQTKELQEGFYKEGLDKLPQDELEDWMRVNAFAAEDEIHEAMDEISWKPWAKAHFFNKDAFVGECVDALHFIANMLVAAGCSDQELNEAYLEKMERNRERQRAGYTGLDKCTGCGRALDDVIAHGGTVDRHVEGGPKCGECVNDLG